MTTLAKSIVVNVVAAGLLFVSAIQGRAQDVKSYTVQTFEEWLKKYDSAKPDFRPGDVIHQDALSKIQPFVPPGEFEQLNFPGVHVEIGASVDHTPRADYMKCTEQYQDQVRLAPDGTMLNYTCGQPFSNSSLTVSDPNAGVKAAWNFDYRWQNFGLACVDIAWHWVRFDGKGANHHFMAQAPPADMVAFAYSRSELPQGDLSYLYLGNGSFERTLQSNYRRVYYSHLAQLPSHVLPIVGASDLEFKEVTAFFDPFDIRGTAFIIYRYADPHRADDAWAYIPNLRRVRRISAEVKSDSLLGTDFTLDDFYTFSGREVDWNFKFLGWKDVLVIANRKHTYARFYGPNSMIPDDVWSLRRAAVVMRTPKDSRHPYSAAIMFWDSQNYGPQWHFAFDKKGRLWKVFEWQYKWSENYHKEWAEINQGARSITFPTADVLDVQNARGTIVDGFGCGFPPIDTHLVQGLYDTNKLEQLHR